MKKHIPFKNHKKITRLRMAVLVLIMIAIAIIGAYVSYAAHHHSGSLVKTGIGSASQDARTSSRNTNDMSSDQKSDVTSNAVDNPDMKESNINHDYVPIFNFVNTSDWVTVPSRDKSFSVRYNRHYVYDTCPDLSDNLMTAMAGPTDDNILCVSLQNVVTIRPYNGDINSGIYRAETIIAQTDDVWDHGDGTPVTVTLAGGQTATRYAFNSTILDKSYSTIEYDATVDGKRYVAINNWQVTKPANTSIDDFDTMIQKTWLFASN